VNEVWRGILQQSLFLDAQAKTASLIAGDAKSRVLVQIKVKVTGHECPEGERMYSCTLPSGARWGMGGQPHAPAALPPGKTRYSLYRRLGAENLAPTGIQSPDRPACSESLYRLSYPGPACVCSHWILLTGRIFYHSIFRSNEIVTRLRAGGCWVWFLVGTRYFSLLHKFTPCSGAPTRIAVILPWGNGDRRL